MTKSVVNSSLLVDHGLHERTSHKKATEMKAYRTNSWCKPGNNGYNTTTLSVVLLLRIALHAWTRVLIVVAGREDAGFLDRYRWIPRATAVDRRRSLEQHLVGFLDSHRDAHEVVISELFLDKIELIDPPSDGGLKCSCLISLQQARRH